MRLRSLFDRIAGTAAVVLISLGAAAATVPPELATRVARAWMAREGRSCAASVSTSRFVTTNNAAYYAVRMRDGGTVITTGDTAFEPVILISGESIDFETLDSHSPLRDLLNGDAAARGPASVSTGATPMLALATKAALAQALQTARTAAHAQTWAELAQEGEMQVPALTVMSALAGSEVWVYDPYTVRTGLSDIRVAPLCQTRWSQSTAQGKVVYNYYTPNGSDPAAFTPDATTNVVCGCVATAMSQVMRYFEWPKASVTPVTRTCSWFETEMDLVMKGGVYDWANMPLVPASGTLSDEQRQAIGKLTSDVGISVYMGYNTPNGDGSPSEESGAYSFDVAVALRDVFGYADATWFYDRYDMICGTYDPDQFDAVRSEALQRALYTNLDAGLPTVMGLSGHEVVADGYGYSSSGLDYVHINMGWAGSCDYWYCLPSVVYAESGSGLSFNDLTYNVFTNVAEKSAAVSGRVYDVDGVPLAGASVRFYRTDGQVLQTTVVSNDKGVYGAVVPVGSYTVESDQDGVTNRVSVSVSAPVTRDIPWNDGLHGDIPTVCTSKPSDLGNSWGNDILLGAEPEPDPEPAAECLYVRGDAGDDDNDGQTWETAKRTIQAAIDAVADGSTVIVGPGEYAPIVTTNRSLTIQSEYGAYSTAIDGGGTNRCADLGREVSHTNTVLIGFTLQNGCAEGSWGGGVMGGRLQRCILRSNQAQWGGGAHSSTLSNCLLFDNSAEYGGGANGCRLFNCTVTRNEATEEGGGIVTGGWNTRNCIVWGNDAPENEDVSGGNCEYTCAGVLLSGEGNICADPRFFDSDADDFTLRYDSPCLDAGDNSVVTDNQDLSEWTRILNGTVDMGAYEGFWLDAPTDVSATDGTSTESVTITWSPVEGATAYGIYRTETEEYDYWNSEYLGWTDGTIFEDESCTAGQTYWYWVVSGCNRVDGWGYLSAGDSGYRLPLFPYEIGDDGAIVTGYNGSDTDVVIPDEIDGHPVTGIAEGAFRGCRRMRSVTIPDSVTSIGDYAFENCMCLTSVTIPDSVASVGEGAFTGCTGLRTVTVPQCVCADGLWYSFDSDTITKVVIADGVEYIESYAFSGFYRLKEVTIPESVTYIGDSAFENCQALKIAKLPSGLETLGAGAFAGCESLTAMTIPNGVTSLASQTFADCYALRRVTFPNGVGEIQDQAFDGCCALEDVTIPGGVTFIGEEAFRDCTSLAGLTIPDSVTEIGTNAFTGCTALERVTVPQCVIEAGLASVFDENQLLDVTISDGVTAISDSAFSACGILRSVTIPNSVESIGESAFQECPNLQAVKLPRSTKAIGGRAFADCPKLTAVTVPYGVEAIGEAAFASCIRLAAVTLSASVTNVGSSAFCDCGRLADVAFEGNAPEVGEDAFADVSPYCIAWVERSSTGWNVPIPGTWRGMDIQYVPYYSYAACGENLTATSTDAGWTVASKNDVPLTQDDLDSVEITAMLADGTEANTTKGYDVSVSADGKTALFSLKEPEIDTAVVEEGEVEADPDDRSGVLVNVDPDEIEAAPTVQSGESVGALPVTAVEGLWYQASWGDDLGNMTQGVKVQATDGTLYLGVVRQTADRGFYRISVSEK